MPDPSCSESFDQEEANENFDDKNTLDLKLLNALNKMLANKHRLSTDDKEQSESSTD